MTLTVSGFRGPQPQRTMEPGLHQEARDLVGRARPAAAHRHEIEARSRRRRSARRREIPDIGSATTISPFCGRALRTEARIAPRLRVVVVVQDAHQGRDVRPLGQRIAEHVAAGDGHPRPEARRLDPRPRPLGDRGQVEENDLELGEPSRARIAKSPSPPPTSRRRPRLANG